MRGWKRAGNLDQRTWQASQPQASPSSMCSALSFAAGGLLYQASDVSLGQVQALEVDDAMDP
jgi:hypothetical protein